VAGHSRFAICGRRTVLLEPDSLSDCRNSTNYAPAAENIYSGPRMKRGFAEGLNEAGKVANGNLFIQASDFK
jgi:hypothetical protein